MAIDFGDAFTWTQGDGEKIVPRGPPALEANVDPLRVSESLAVIEKLTPAQISSCCAVFEHRPDVRSRIESMLQRRQPLLRAAACKWLR